MLCLDIVSQKFIPEVLRNIVLNTCKYIWTQWLYYSTSISVTQVNVKNNNFKYINTQTLVCTHNLFSRFLPMAHKQITTHIIYMKKYIK